MTAWATREIDRSSECGQHVTQKLQIRLAEQSDEVLATAEDLVLRQLLGDAIALGGEPLYDAGVEFQEPGLDPPDLLEDVPTGEVVVPACLRRDSDLATSSFSSARSGSRSRVCDR